MASCACTARSVGAHKRNSVTPPVAASSAPKIHTHMLQEHSEVSAPPVLGGWFDLSPCRGLVRYDLQSASSISSGWSGGQTQHCWCRVTLVTQPFPAGSRAESSRGGGFASGFIVGGALFGTLGFLFAPQVSSSSGTHVIFLTLHLPAPMLCTLWQTVV